MKTPVPQCAIWLCQIFGGNNKRAMPEIDGRVLFENASARVRGDVAANTTIGDIIMVAPVKAARDRIKRRTPL